MIDYELYCQIKDRHDKDRLTIAQIARQLHLNARTVGRWLAADKFRQRQTPPRPSKLDPYKGQVVRWLQTHPYTAAQIFLRLRQAGYDGGITIVKEYVHQIRPPRTPAFPHPDLLWAAFPTMTAKQLQEAVIYDEIEPWARSGPTTAAQPRTCS